MLPEAQDPARVAGGGHLSLHRPEAGGGKASGTKLAVSPELCGFRLACATQNLHFEKNRNISTFEPIEISKFQARSPQA